MHVGDFKKCDVCCESENNTIIESPINEDIIQGVLNTPINDDLAVFMNYSFKRNISNGSNFK